MEHHEPAMLNFSVLDEYFHSPSICGSVLATHDQRNMEENFIGSVEVYIHEARNIHNICIYQNQDVYAKVFSTDKPEKKISSKVINGGGKNPVINETLRLDVQTMDSSLRCEVWMLSRIKNYLEDQLLGFVLLPLSDVVSASGKGAREFELSSSELFHSPAGFVELSFNFTGGTSTEVPIEILTKSPSSGGAKQGLDDSNICCELDKIEFPDQEIVNENERMVSEYLRYPSETQEPEEKAESENDDNNLSVKSDDDSLEKAPVPVSLTAHPINSVSVDAEQNVVQEEIVDMYMKGMQQFTDALAKMKLPMDIAEENNTSDLPQESSSDGKAKASKTPHPTPKVFYGSRAFF